MLTVASGGVRGIVQLRFLEAIQEELGKDLRIQWFFDLVVGTRYASAKVSVSITNAKNLVAAARAELPL
jgi:hypothetical protein